MSFLLVTSSLLTFSVYQTDGLTDNVFPTEIISICSLVARSGGSEDEQVQAMADRVVGYARQCMANRRRVSPFESMFFKLFFHFQTLNLTCRRGCKGRNVLPRRGKLVSFFYMGL
jgi:hypothetical protein